MFRPTQENLSGCGLSCVKADLICDSALPTGQACARPALAFVHPVGSRVWWMMHRPKSWASGPRARGRVPASQWRPDSPSGLLFGWPKDLSIAWFGRVPAADSRGLGQGIVPSERLPDRLAQGFGRRLGWPGPLAEARSGWARYACVFPCLSGGFNRPTTTTKVAGTSSGGDDAGGFPRVEARKSLAFN